MTKGRLTRSLAAAALAAAPILTAAPAAGAELPAAPASRGPSRVDAFAGARLRVPMGGRKAGQVRLGLAVAPAQRREDSAGAAKLRFGEGLELSLAGREPAGLRVAGYRLAPGGTLTDEDGRRLGVSTIGAVAIGTGVVLVSAVIIALAIRSGED